VGRAAAKPAVLHVAAAQVAAVAGEADREVDACVQRQRRHQCPGRGQLLGPRRSSIPHADGRLDAVEGGQIWGAEPAVTGPHRHPFHARAGQVGAGSGGDGLVNLDAGDLPSWRDQVGQQRSIVAAARADLQDVVAGLGVELVEHHRHDPGLAGAAQRGAVRPAVAGHGVVLVDALDGDLGRKYSRRTAWKAARRRGLSSSLLVTSWSTSRW
jgi:hypothetical protein